MLDKGGLLPLRLSLKVAKTNYRPELNSPSKDENSPNWSPVVSRYLKESSLPEFLKL